MQLNALLSGKVTVFALPAPGRLRCHLSENLSPVVFSLQDDQQLLLPLVAIRILLICLSYQSLTTVSSRAALKAPTPAVAIAKKAVATDKP